MQGARHVRRARWEEPHPRELPLWRAPPGRGRWTAITMKDNQVGLENKEQEEEQRQQQLFRFLSIEFRSEFQHPYSVSTYPQTQIAYG